jgi:hypothetical protein
MIRSRLIVCGECSFRSPEAKRETLDDDTRPSPRSACGQDRGGRGAHELTAARRSGESRKASFLEQENNHD